MSTQVKTQYGWLPKLPSEGRYFEMTNFAMTESFSSINANIFSWLMPISGSDLVAWKHQFYRQVGSNPIPIGTALMEVSDAA